jgi:hypothetical protein
MKKFFFFIALFKIIPFSYLSASTIEKDLNSRRPLSMHITQPEDFEHIVEHYGIPKPLNYGEGRQFSIQNIEQFLKGPDFSKVQNFFKTTPVSEDGLDEYNLANALIHRNFIPCLKTQQQREQSAYIRSMMYFLGTKNDPEGDPFINIIPAYIDVANLESQEDQSYLVEGLITMIEKTLDLYRAFPGGEL